MELATATIHKTGPNNYQVSHGEDRELYVEFENIPVHQVAESELAGRAIYKDVPHIKIMFPGDRTKQVCRRVKTESTGGTPSDMERFPRQWAAFEAQQEQSQDGTPLEQWPIMTKSQVMEFRSLHIHTVDALAALSDAAVQNIGIGGRELREKAKAWLSKADDGAEVSRLVTENRDMAEKIELLQRQMADINALYAEDKPKKIKTA